MKNIFLNGILSLAIGLGFVACNDDDTYISTAPIITEVTTDGATVTSTTATITGTVMDLSSMLPSRYEVGVKYATSEAALPAGGTKVTGSLGEDGSTVTVEISGLQPEQQYFYCIYVTLQGKVSEYGEVKPLLTTDRTIATMPAASVTRTPHSSEVRSITSTISLPPVLNMAYISLRVRISPMRIALLSMAAKTAIRPRSQA